ncbi:hypothetical protein DFQ29_006964 [Apophysomyces sp. BC1021]|nr:hypothetical protein DFQ29_006964 [Apophysomyces sp. BC1021]
MSKTVIKVTRAGKPEEIVHCNTSVNERQTEDSARWFYMDLCGGRPPVEELVYRQPSPFPDQPRDDYEGWSLQNSQESSQDQTLSDTIKNGNIIRILCHYVEKIYLNDECVRYR